MTTPSGGSGLFVLFYDTYNFNGRRYELFQDIHPNEIEDGYKLLFHQPLDLPTLESLKFRVSGNKLERMKISFDIMTADDSLISLTPEE